MSYLHRKYFSLPPPNSYESFTGAEGPPSSSLSQTVSDSQVFGQLPARETKVLPRKKSKKQSHRGSAGKKMATAQVASNGNYANRPLVDWNYNCSVQGLYCPKNWSQMKNYENNQCGAINSQSPVNLVPTDGFPNLKFSYRATSHRGRVVNLGPLIRIECSGPNSLRVDGDDYHLKFIDLHTPSEHTVGQNQFDVEFQLIHVPKGSGSTKYTYVAVALLLDSDDKQYFGNSIWDRINQGQSFILPKDGRPTVSQQNAFNPRELERVILDPKSKFYHYTGSLTIPPCTSNVQWIVVTPPYHCSKFDQNLRSIVGSNNRPIQSRQQ
jgi:carbonic anhydrase